MKQFVAYYLPQFLEDVENDAKTIYASVRQNKNVVQAKIGWDITSRDKYVEAESKDGYCRKLYVMDGLATLTPGARKFFRTGARKFFRMSEAIKWLAGTNNAIEYNDFAFDLHKVSNRYHEFKNTLPDYTHTTDQIAKWVPLVKPIQLRIKNGTMYTTIIWSDGSTPTVVKRAKDDPNDLYFAVASAIAIKMYGSNSAFKRMINDSLLPRLFVSGEEIK